APLAGSQTSGPGSYPTSMLERLVRPISRGVVGSSGTSGRPTLTRDGAFTAGLICGGARGKEEEEETRAQPQAYCPKPYPRRLLLTGSSSSASSSSLSRTTYCSSVVRLSSSVNSSWPNTRRLTLTAVAPSLVGTTRPETLRSRP